MSIRKIPEHDELLMEFNQIQQELNLDRKESVRYLANKYNCTEKTIYRGMRTLQNDKKYSIPECWIEAFTNEWNIITERLISGKYIVIIKKLDYKIIPKSKIPRGFLY